MEITLDDLLKARDTRRELQLSLPERHPGAVPVVLTVNIPGNVKRTPRSVAIGREGMRVLAGALTGVVETFERDLPTGYEGYMMVDGDARLIKETTVAIEEGHPLGRLLDIDVIGGDGVPLSRTDAGGAPRRCLICNEEARACMRSRAHTVEELNRVINRIHDEYFRQL